MKINLLVKEGFAGLIKDREILERELALLGHETSWFWQSSKATEADLNIHLESIYPKAVEKAKTNWLIPNPEWFTQELETLDLMDLIVCKTYQAEKAFQDIGYKTFFLGFTTDDCYDPKVEKDFHALLHYQGGSHLRGTFWLERAWAGDANHQLPPLTIRRSPYIAGPGYEKGSLKVHTDWMDDKAFRELQARSGIYLCPSEAEGYCHVINEGLSAGSIVITLDAPAMNEMVKDPECLVPIKNPHRDLQLHNLIPVYSYDVRELIKKVEHLLTYPREVLLQKGQENRQRYLQNKSDFKTRLEFILGTV